MSPVYLVVSLFLLSVRAEDIKCGVNEEIVKCPKDSPYDYCPKQEDDVTTSTTVKCTKAYKCPTPACKCKVNYRRAENGTCIQTTDCPPFPCTRPNEVYDPCPVYCPTDDCSQASVDGKCPIFGFVIFRECAPKCRCIKGYWRKEGVCVPYEEC